MQLLGGALLTAGRSQRCAAESPLDSTRWRYRSAGVG